MLLSQTMKLEYVDGSFQSYVHMERYCGGGSRTYSPHAAYTEVSQIYRPDFKGMVTSELLFLRMDRSELRVRVGNPSPELRRTYVEDDGDRLRFYVHPQLYWNSDDPTVLWLKERILEGISVVPTASSRTLITALEWRNFPTHFIKTHLPVRVSRMVRSLTSDEINSAVLTSVDVEKMKNPQCGFLPDVFGAWLPGEQWGYLIREYKPRPYTDEERAMIPFFALYSQDILYPNDDPLLVQMINQLGVNPQQFVQDKIINAQIEAWCQVARERGIIMEPHGQNTLLEVGLDHQPKRIIERDLDCFVDGEIRRENGLDTPFDRCMLGVDVPREPRFSLHYDHHLGRMLLDYIADLSQKFFGISVTELQRDARDRFAEVFPNYMDFFPKTVYKMSEGINSDNSVTLVNSGQNPIWRP